MTIMQQSYDVCFLRYGAQQAEFFVILDHFCPVFSFFQNFDFQGTYKFWKNEKTPKGIITLQMCTINDNHMMYGSRNLESMVLESIYKECL